MKYIPGFKFIIETKPQQNLSLSCVKRIKKINNDNFIHGNIYLIRRIFKNQNNKIEYIFENITQQNVFSLEFDSFVIADNQIEKMALEIK